MVRQYVFVRKSGELYFTLRLFVAVSLPLGLCAGKGAYVRINEA